jgi:hypothetical protein
LLAESEAGYREGIMDYVWPILLVFFLVLLLLGPSAIFRVLRSLLTLFSLLVAVMFVIGLSYHLDDITNWAQH